MREDIVVSIGGSILLPKEDDIEGLKNLSKMLLKVSEDFNLYLVTGGGRIARKYIRWGRSLGVDEAALDELGIRTSRLNARLLILALGKKVYPVPALGFDEAISAGNHYNIVTMGGTHPGHTTDAVSAMLAERLRCKRLINVTSVDGVYSDDPRLDKEATRFDRLDHDELISIVGKNEGRAGPNVVFDPLAAKIIKRAGIKTYIVSGDDLKNIEAAIKDEEFHGTIIGDT